MGLSFVPRFSGDLEAPLLGTWRQAFCHGSNNKKSIDPYGHPSSCRKISCRVCHRSPSPAECTCCAPESCPAIAASAPAVSSDRCVCRTSSSPCQTSFPYAYHRVSTRTQSRSNRRPSTLLHETSAKGSSHVGLTVARFMEKVRPS
ncbi:hypothetical protein BHM03_00047273 [Ensete ventricosum]|nr:hypothetical protein BHM03_00047273 [Ensete ventricosum]